MDVVGNNNNNNDMNISPNSPRGVSSTNSSSYYYDGIHHITTSTTTTDDTMSTTSTESSCNSDDIRHPNDTTTTTATTMMVPKSNHHLIRKKIHNKKNNGNNNDNDDNEYYDESSQYEKSMKKHRNNKNNGNGIYISYRHMIILFITFILFIILIIMSIMFVLNQKENYSSNSNSSTSTSSTNTRLHLNNNNNQNMNLYHLRTSHTHYNTNTNIQSSELSSSSSQIIEPESQCRWYLGESAIPNSGLGIYSGISLQKDDMIGYPDICIFVADGPTHWTHLRSHSFGRASFFGQYDGQQHNNRAACEGIITTVNTVPDTQVNMIMISPIVATNAGLHRDYSPGAGAITPHYGIHGKATTTISAGSEITIDYGDWDFDDEQNENNMYNIKPYRDVVWLQHHAWCIDNIYIDISTIPHAGRGAFARIALSKGTVVAPAPLQVFNDRSIFQSIDPITNTITSEQLFVNYCIQPANSKMLLYPYGQGVNLINHSYKQPNVEFRWSTNTINKMHHDEYLDLSTMEEFWNIVSPGKLILEIVALRDIEPHEEIVLNYGTAWENAWNIHVQQWNVSKRSEDEGSYVYASEMDETLPLRTVYEQVHDPYPNNLITMCITSGFNRGKKRHNNNDDENNNNSNESDDDDNNYIQEWQEPDYINEESYSWAEWMTYCHILNRTHDNILGEYVYTVSLLFGVTDPNELVFHHHTDDTNNNNVTTKETPMDTTPLSIDYNVPRRAIRFIEKPYMDDEHLPTAFRHPIELPIHLVPDLWKDY